MAIQVSRAPCFDDPRVRQPVDGLGLDEGWLPKLCLCACAVGIVGYCFDLCMQALQRKARVQPEVTYFLPTRPLEVPGYL